MKNKLSIGDSSVVFNNILYTLLAVVTIESIYLVFAVLANFEKYHSYKQASIHVVTSFSTMVAIALGCLAISFVLLSGCKSLLAVYLRTHVYSIKYSFTTDVILVALGAAAFAGVSILIVWGYFASIPLWASIVAAFIPSLVIRTYLDKYINSGNWMLTDPLMISLY